MIVECGHCGAPLDIEEGREVVTCDYCAKKNHVSQLKTLEPITPPDFKAPEVWRPSADDAGVRRRFRWGYAVVPLVFALIAIAALMMRRGSTLDEVARQPLESTPDQIAHDLQVTYRTDDGVRVTLQSGSPYEHVWYRWSDTDFSLPTSISLFVKEGESLSPNVLASLSKQLHGGLDESGAWSWGPVSIRANQGVLSIEVKRTFADAPNPVRRRQLTAAWQVVRSAAFGGPTAPAKELVEVLGGGYPTKDLGALDGKMRFRQARSEIQKVFPGALAEDSSYVIALDHPLIYSIQLSWHNAAEGALHGAHFRVTPGFKKSPPPLLSCLSKELGAPTEGVTDFAQGKKRWVYTVRGSNDLGSRLEMVLGDEADLYLVSPSEGFDPAAWRRTFEVLDRCR